MPEDFRPEDFRPETELLAGAGWDLPLTDSFVAGVRRGVRRRRALRRTVAGGALLAVAGAATLALGPGGGGAVPETAAPPAASPAAGALDGFRLGHLPEGLRAVPPDSVLTCAASATPGDCRTPERGADAVAGTARRFDKGAGMAMWVTVLRPQATTGRDRITAVLEQAATAGKAQDETFAAPAGRARLLTTAGTEVTVRSIVLTTPDGVVITVEGAAGLTAAELKQVALGIEPA